MWYATVVMGDGLAKAAGEFSDNSYRAVVRTYYGEVPVEPGGPTDGREAAETNGLPVLEW